MKNYRKALWVEAPGRRAFITITSEVQSRIDESVVKEGLALVKIIGE